MRARSGLPRDGAAVRAGIASGRYVRGETVRTATGSGRGVLPMAGDILVDDEVSSVTPKIRTGQQAVAWEVIEHGRWVSKFGWECRVVGIRDGGA